MARRNLQLLLLKNESSRYGGDLLKTRKGRTRARPLAVRSTMHLVLRSSQAVGPQSFRRHAPGIERIVGKFSRKYHVRILSSANVGNHLHFHIQLPHRQAYRPFIRAITAAIAMAVTGVNRWRKAGELKAKKFWDQRPFTRILNGLKDRIGLKDYIEINQLEGLGRPRTEARELVIEWQEQRGPPVWALVT